MQGVDVETADAVQYLLRLESLDNLRIKLQEVNALRDDDNSRIIWWWPGPAKALHPQDCDKVVEDHLGCAAVMLDVVVCDMAKLGQALSKVKSFGEVSNYLEGMTNAQPGKRMFAIEKYDSIEELRMCEEDLKGLLSVVKEWEDEPIVVGERVERDPDLVILPWVGRSER